MVCFCSIPCDSVYPVAPEAPVKIKQLPSGRWLVRVSYMQDGKQKEISKTFTRRREAEAWQRHHEVNRDAGTFRRPSRMTVDAYLDQWLREVQGRIDDRTRRDHEGICERYLRPALGTRRLDQVRVTDVRDMLAGLTARGLSPRTVNHARATLRRALNTAVADGLLLSNPAAGRDLVPKVERGEPKVLSGAQVNHLLDATTDDPLHSLWAVLGTTGMRLSEGLGLRWSDVHFDRAEVRITKTLYRPGSGAEWRLKDTKTEQSRRVVPLLPVTLGALARHRDRQEVERLVTAAGYRDHGFIFAGPRGEPLRGDGVHKYHWVPTLKRLGLPRVRLHDLRHGAATMLLEAGTAMKVVQEMLGHSSITVTSDLYSHVTPGLARQAADALSGHLAAARKATEAKAKSDTE
jgi:integrase